MLGSRDHSVGEFHLVCKVQRGRGCGAPDLLFVLVLVTDPHLQPGPVRDQAEALRLEKAPSATQCLGSNCQLQDEASILYLERIAIAAGAPNGSSRANPRRFL